MGEVWGNNGHDENYIDVNKKDKTSEKCENGLIKDKKYKSNLIRNPFQN